MQGGRAPRPRQPSGRRRDAGTGAAGPGRSPEVAPGSGASRAGRSVAPGRGASRAGRSRAGFSATLPAGTGGVTGAGNEGSRGMKPGRPPRPGRHRRKGDRPRRSRQCRGSPPPAPSPACDRRPRSRTHPCSTAQRSSPSPNRSLILSSNPACDMVDAGAASFRHGMVND